MGYYADRSQGKGQMYLVTRDEEPFCGKQRFASLSSLLSQPPSSSPVSGADRKLTEPSTHSQLRKDPDNANGRFRSKRNFYHDKVRFKAPFSRSKEKITLLYRKDDEEMKLGQSISRIIVPHPILSELTKVQIVYSAYSGWLSSGLTQWKIDKVSLSDSFGKRSA